MPTKYLSLEGLQYYDSKIKDYIVEKDLQIMDGDWLTSSDKTVTLNRNSTNHTTDLSVNIDGTTLTKDPTTGTISVTNSALVLYTGDNKAIEVSEVSGGYKTISLKIADDDKFLTANTTAGDADGLKANIQLAKFDAATTATLGSNIAEAWALVDKNGNAITGTNNNQVIKIYKDSSLINTLLGHIGALVDSATGTITDGAATNHDALILVYQLANGSYQGQVIDLGAFLTESEFGDGLQVIPADTTSANGVVSVKVDPTSESVNTTYNGNGAATATSPVLSVGSNGVKINNILNAIDAKVNSLDSTVSANITNNTVTSGHFVGIDIVENDGKLTSVSILENNIASASDLQAEILRAEDAETAIDSVVGLTKGNNDETRTYTNSGTYIGQNSTNTIKSDIKALDNTISDIVSGEIAINTISYSGNGNDIDALFA